MPVTLSNSLFNKVVIKTHEISGQTAVQLPLTISYQARTRERAAVRIMNLETSDVIPNH
jgi:hypothetical protein